MQNKLFILDNKEQLYGCVEELVQKVNT